LLTIKEREERSKGFCYPKLEALLECFVAQNGQHLPFFWQESAKISKLKLVGNAGNAENVQNNSQKNYVSENIIFYH
jgi:hypothetical protein